MTTIAVVIPSLNGDVQELRASIASQRLQPDELEVVVGVRPNGRARNIGVARTSAPIVVFIDDDAVLGHPGTLRDMVAPLLEHRDVAVSGAAKLIPASSSRFQRLVARQVPRIEHPVVAETTFSDPPVGRHGYTDVTTTCCAIRRAVLVEVGGFDDRLLRGVDTELFYRIRRCGYRFVLAANTWVYHPAPRTFRALMAKHVLYGIGYAQEVRRHPERAAGRYLRTPLHALVYLLLRTALIVPHCFVAYSHSAPSSEVTFRPLGALASYASALGYVYGWYRQATEASQGFLEE